MTKKKHILFLINPISGVGKKNIIPKCIDKYLDKSKFDYHIQNTEYRKHGFEIASRKKSNFDCVVAIGGDGTVNEIGSALIHSNTALGIIPTGSGNGLARHLEIPLKIKLALLTINQFKEKIIDTGLVNSIPFLGTCGFGFDAHIAKKFDEFHKRGFMSYARLIYKEFGDYKPLTFKITTAFGTTEKTALMLAVANSSQFGNGFTIAPQSNISDGKFEYVCLDKFKKREIVILGKQFFNQQIDQSKHFSTFTEQTEVTIEVENNKQTVYHIDGEPMIGPNLFKIKVVPQSLKIIC